MTDGAAEGETTRRVLRRLGWGLAFSVAVNVFLVGVVTMDFMRHRAHRFSPRAEPPGASHEGPRLRQLMRAHRGDLREQREALHDARRGVVEALKAEPFDQAALAAAFTELRKQTQASQQSLHEALVETASGLNRRERLQLMEGLREGRRPGPGHR